MIKKKTILITGATSGIGKACAIKFADDGCNLIITGRRMKLLEELAASIKKKGKADVRCLDFDVRDKKTTEEKIQSLSGKWKEVDVLINNAGLVIGLEPIQDGNTDDWDIMIDTNIKGLLYVTRAVAPLMIKRGSGQIINIGSIAGKETYPNGNIYCATKSAVDALSKAMRIDMLKYNMKVTAVHPGATETEFSLVRFRGDKKKADEVYKGFTPLTGMDIAEVVHYITTLPPHVNINDIVVMPTAQANTVHFNKNL